MPKLPTGDALIFRVSLYNYLKIATENMMRTNIMIDDELMTDVLKLTGIKSKREAVEQGLRILLALKQQEKIKQFKGALKWEGDLEKMRSEQ